MASIRVGRLGTQLWCLSKIIIVFPYQIPLGGKLHWQAPECVFKCVLEVSCYPGSWHWAVMSNCIAIRVLNERCDSCSLALHV